jgi:hypothetical protein
MLFAETVAVYCENHMERITVLRVQNAEFLRVEAGGTYCYRSGPAAIISPIQHGRNYVHSLLPRVYSAVSLVPSEARQPSVCL